MSPMVEEVAAEEEVDLDMDEVKEEYFDMNEVEAEDAVENSMVAVVAVVRVVEEESITILTTKMEGRITTMELIHHILQETLHLN